MNDAITHDAIMNDVIFREYDIRGKVDQDLKVDEVYNLGRAIACYLLSRNPHFKTMAIGMDGRIHSSVIKDHLSRAMQESGIDVQFIGICPTPVLYFTLHNKPVDGGIMITASHNTKEYNGFKICLGKESVWGKQIQEIKKMYHEKKSVISPSRGVETSMPMIDLYLDWLVNHFPDLRGMQRSVVVDCGNGAAGTVLPQLIERMQWKNVRLLFEEVDGTYPNHEADPTVEKNMRDVKKIMQDTDTQLGLGIDGDCDRMAPMTKKGTLVSGDALLALFAQPVALKHPGVGVVFDIKSSSGLIELLERWGARPIMSPSGHSIIKDMMREKHALLGGELSCHFFFKDVYFGYDDGIYAMLRLFQLLDITGKSLDELLLEFPHKYSSRELRLFCPDENKQTVIEALKVLMQKRNDVSIITIDGIRVSFPFGWGIVRSSNTQPALSMRFESDSKDGLQRVMAIFHEALSEHLSHEALVEFEKERDA